MVDGCPGLIDPILITPNAPSIRAMQGVSKYEMRKGVECRWGNWYQKVIVKP